MFTSTLQCLDACSAVAEKFEVTDGI